jgi:transcriptional regulator with XRE-family HTH domain
MDNKKIGELLVGKRTSIGLTPMEMAERIGCNRTTVERWEKGETHVPRNKVTKIARAYEMQSRELAELCGFPFELLTADLRESEIFASSEDLEFLLTIARGLKTPMSLAVIRDLLKCRQVK